MEPQVVTIEFCFRTVPGLSSNPEPADGHTDLHSTCWYSWAIGTQGYEGERVPQSARMKKIEYIIQL